MEDLNADLFDEDFEDDLEDLELDEEELDELQEVLLDDLENDEIDSQEIANTNIWPPVVRRGANLFYILIACKYSYRNRNQLLQLLQPL